jgi:hypothetical protein
MHELNDWLGFWHFRSHQQGDFKKGLYVKTFNRVHVHIIKFGVPCLTYMNHSRMHEFLLDELVDMPTCNLFETIHNIQTTRNVTFMWG